MRSLLRQPLVWLAAMLLLGSLGLHALLIYQDLPVTRGKITKANFKRIQIGMKYQEVEQILEVPPGAYGHGTIGYSGPPNIGPKPDCRGAIWWGDEIVIIIWFDEKDGLVAEKEFRNMLRAPVESISAKLHRLLRL